MVDLIKEAMLRTARYAKGYLLNGFPRTNKQATLFVNEVGDVDVVVFLYSDTQIMVTRTQEKSGGQTDTETIKKNIQNYLKEVKESVSKFGAKIEKVMSFLTLKLIIYFKNRRFTRMLLPVMFMVELKQQLTLGLT